MEALNHQLSNFLNTALNFIRALVYHRESLAARVCLKNQAQASEFGTVLQILAKPRGP